MSTVKKKQKIELCSDEELMLMYQNDLVEAFDELYRRHGSRVYGYLCQKTDAESAQEILQETFAKLHQSRKQYQSKYPFLPWLFTIAHNNFLDFYKRAESKLNRASTNDHQALEKIEDTTAQSGSSSIEINFTEALAHLPEAQRKAIELRYLQDWSFADIAQELATSEENSRKLISRGVKSLKVFFKRETS